MLSWDLDSEQLQLELGGGGGLMGVPGDPGLWTEL